MNRQQAFDFKWGNPAAHDALSILIYAALGMQQSRMYFEIGNNGANPHMDAELEMKQEHLDDAVINYVHHSRAVLAKIGQKADEPSAEHQRIIDGIVGGKLTP